MLADIYLDGINIKKNKDLAFIWGYKSAMADDKLGNAFMAKYYYNENFSQCFKYLKRAAELGELNSQLALGIIYYKGNQEIKQNLTEALKWLKKAASRGQPQAKTILQRLNKGKQIQK